MDRPRRQIQSAVGVVLGAGSLVAIAAASQPTQTGGDSAHPGAHRLVRVFTFDDDGPDPVPEGWERTTLTPDGRTRPGFPLFNRPELDDQVSHSGARSVRLATSGGCAALRLRAGEAAVYEDADYAVSAWLRTDGLEHARAFITARLLDQHLRVIPGSEVRSDPVVSPGAWRLHSVQVPGGRPGAAWMQIDLELLQPRQFTPPAPDEPAAQALEKHRLYREDVRGSAWFDDVAIMQIPRADLTTQSRSNLVPPGETPELRITVRDLGGEELRGRVRVLDVRGRVADDQPAEIHPDGRVGTLRPRLRDHGWYHAELEVMGASRPDEVVTRAQTSFIWLAPGITGGEAEARSVLADRARFGLVAERVPDERLGDLPELVMRLGTRFISLPVWQSDSTLEGAASSLQRRRPAIEALLRLGQEVTFTIGGAPGELSRATRIVADDPLSLATTPAANWLGYLTPTLDIFGQRITRYQIGNVGGDQAFWRQDLAGDAGAVKAALATLVPGPMLALPWPADRALPALDRRRLPDRAGVAAREPLVEALTVSYPRGFGADQLPTVLGLLLAEQPPRELTVVLELPDPARFGEPAAVNELVRRTVQFWRLLGDGASAAGSPPQPGSSARREAVEVGALPAARLALDHPWRWAAGTAADAPARAGGSALQPGPTLAAWAVLMDRLSGRRVVGELAGVPGVRCFILAARNTALGTLERGALVAWNESADPERAVVDAAALGAQVIVVDAFGNQRPIPVSAAAGPGDSTPGRGATPSPLVSVPVGQTPVFIEGIDPYLALFAASVRLEPTFMPAVVREHEHRIRLSNPWPVRITGKLQLKEDSDEASRRRTVTDEWRVSPSGILDFDVAPGQAASIPVTLSYGPGQLAGVKDFVIIARAVADRPYPPIRLRAAVEVGLEDIEMSPELQPTAGNDVVVVVAVTNRGTRSRTLRLETAARSLPGQQLQISGLPAGQTVLRRFVFKDAARMLSGRRIVVSLSDLEEAQRLNKAVLVP